jgi:predicted CXXCH cytochrome family protein
MILPVLVWAAEVPAIKKDCKICHGSHAMAGQILLNKPIVELCLDCHPDRKAPNEHKVDMKPSMDVEGLPLIESKMTCVTCHDPHKNPHGMLLRAPAKDLCLVCHKT